VNTFEVLSVNVSRAKGTPKTPVASAVLVENHGLEGDAHAGPGERQVSLLAIESIEKMRHAGTLKPGDFAENITTRGVRLHELPVGTRLFIGEAQLEITRIGKECHTGCAVMRRVGACIMPVEGVFARVVRGGRIHAGSRGHYRVGQGQ